MTRATGGGAVERSGLGLFRLLALPAILALVAACSGDAAPTVNPSTIAAASSPTNVAQPAATPATTVAPPTPSVPGSTPSSGESPSAPPTAAVSPVAASRPPLPTRPPGLGSFASLIERSSSVPYQQLVDRPERYTGDMVYFLGRVREVTHDGEGRFQASINTGGGREVLAVYYAESYFGHPLVRGDSVRFVGTFLGLLPNAAGEPRPAVEVIELLIRFT